MRLCSLGIVASVAFACAADHVYADDPPHEGGNVAAGVDPSDDRLVCPAVPESARLVPRLDTGWLGEGTRSSVLQLSSHAFACGRDVATAFGAASACPSLWALELNVAAVPLSPGRYDLAASTFGSVVWFEPSDDRQGCARTFLRETSLPPTGELIVHAVNDECVVGELVDVALPVGDVAPFHGWFVAQRC